MSWLQWKEMGLVYFKNGEWLEAMNSYTTAIKLKPDEAVLYSNRAICENQLKKFDLARDDAEHAIRLDPSNVKFYRILSESLMGLELFTEAWVVCQEGLKLDPREPTLLLRQHNSVAENGGSTPQTTSSQVETDSISEEENSLDLGKLWAGSFLVSEGHDKLQQHKEEEALKLYREAADLGSAEGMYFLGLMHFKGQAKLPENLEKAVEIWKKGSAAKGAELNGRRFRNSGVGECRNAIGNAFRDGKGVMHSDLEALTWYYKATLEESAEGCFNLGTFFLFGRGTEKDLKKAKTWFQTGIQVEQEQKDIFGDSEDSEDTETFEVSEEFEKLGRKKTIFSAVDEFFTSSRRVMTMTPALEMAMTEMKLQGSVTAKLYFSAKKLLDEATVLLKEEKFQETFMKLFVMWKIWRPVCFNQMPFCRAAATVMEKEPNNHLAIYVYLMTNHFVDFKDKVKLINRCIELDQTNAEYLAFLAITKAILSQTKEEYLDCLQSFDTALALDASSDTIFNRAMFLKAGGTQLFPAQKVMEGFIHFLSVAPYDSENVPRAYYCLAELHAMQNDAEFAAALYLKGLEAEDPRRRLPCFDALDNFRAKIGARTYLKLRKRWPIKVKSPLNMCATCTRIDSLQECSVCKKVWYCSEVCRNNNLVIHKESCA